MSQESNCLDEKTLERAATYPIKPASLELDGQLVKIRPLHSADLVATEQLAHHLYDMSSGKALGGYYGDDEYDADALIWRHMLSGPYSSYEDFAKSRIIEMEIERNFVVYHAQTDIPIGMVALMNHSSKDLRVEIGNTWYVPAAQGTGANRETVYLLLRHLFEVLGYRRVEWRCNNLNFRSRKAALTLGFTMEAVLRQVMICKGLSRDDNVLAMLDGEWPQVKQMLEHQIQATIDAVNN
ncbi:hypothetical protein THRCLA_07261 [Thraustotheca clavata]|uniref:N-acetyltransferase domain-containing protein n=1 Tax=Thraustotheca clavata TaxID=74557 RepID=A0A1V9ZEU8_9STRA|nr:hypothetical protein THRCLA_07261 [Thraustotheca clavata]